MARGLAAAVPGEPRDRDYRPNRDGDGRGVRPNYFAGSNKVTVVKQHDLEPREFSFGNVPLFGAGCQHFEPNALATVLHAVIDTAADHMCVCLAAHFSSGHRPSWAARGTGPRRIRPADRRRRPQPA
jgi:hypothetical protein